MTYVSQYVQCTRSLNQGLQKASKSLAAFENKGNGYVSPFSRDTLSNKKLIYLTP